MTRSDEDLIIRIQSQDTDAFELLVARHEDTIRAHILRTVRNRAAADDLVQELFFRVWTRAGQWQGQGSVKGWLYRIATNLSLNHLRTIRRRREQALDVPSEEEEDKPVPAWIIDKDTTRADEAVEQTEQYDMLRQIIEELPEEKREVFRLVHESELGIRGAAKILGIPEGTVKSRLHYTMKRLAQEWHELNSELEDFS